MFGWSAGADLMRYVATHVGIRFDLRYMRGFKDLNTGVTTIDLNAHSRLHDWRASIGLVLR
jgi:hypothetical protein